MAAACSYKFGPCVDGTKAGTRCGAVSTTSVRGEPRCDKHGAQTHDRLERSAAGRLELVTYKDGVEIDRCSPTADQIVAVRLREEARRGIRN